MNYDILFLNGGGKMKINKKDIMTLAVATCVMVILNSTIYANGVVRTDSLSPILEKGDRVIYNRLDKDVEAGDVALIKIGDKQYSCVVTDTSDDKVSINNNDLGSITVDDSQVKGSAMFRYFPFNKIGKIK